MFVRDASTSYSSDLRGQGREIHYRIYSIKRPGRLFNFWTFRVGAYSWWALKSYLKSTFWGWGGGGGRLFEAGRLLTFSTFRVGALSRWALIRG